MTTLLTINKNANFIDTVTHNLTGAQCLFYLMRIWQDSQAQPVLLWCHGGEVNAKINAIRVALSKERAARELPRTFELKFSGVWPHTHEGIKGQAVKIEYSTGSSLTKMKAAFVALTQQEKERWLKTRF